MKRIFLFIASFPIFIYKTIFAISEYDMGFKDGWPSSSILSSDGSVTPIAILTIIQSFLLKVVLPIVIVGASLYIAYELFTADGDEAKLKRAWKSVAYSAIALVAIALSYALVSIISRLSF